MRHLAALPRLQTVEKCVQRLDPFVACHDLIRRVRDKQSCLICGGQQDMSECVNGLSQCEVALLHGALKHYADGSKSSPRRACGSRPAKSSSKGGEGICLVQQDRRAEGVQIIVCGAGWGFAVLPGGGAQYPAMPSTGGATFAGLRIVRPLGSGARPPANAEGAR
jgi:hypothetical protein